MPSSQLKSHALERIAILSATPLSNKGSKDTFSGLYLTCKHGPELHEQGSGDQVKGFGRHSAELSPTPMELDELHAVLALCKAAPHLSRLTEAERFLDQLTPYLSEASTQKFSSSPFLRLIEPSPWDALTTQLVSAMLAIGSRFPSLSATVYTRILNYLESCAKDGRARGSMSVAGDDTASGLRDTSLIRDAMVSVSLLGFLEAASSYFYLFNVRQRYQLLTILRDILTESFMVSIEGAFSSIRTSNSSASEVKEWRFFAKRYATMSRPLGAMLIQCAFMKLLVSCTALEITVEKDLQDHNIHDILLFERNQEISENDDHFALVGLIVDIVSEEMRLLEDGADYLQLGSAWQQHLAFSARQYALTAFLNCVIFDGELADVDVLMAWLEEVMSDPVQMADNELAATVLDSVAVVAKHFPAIATTLSRSLPRFIVQGRVAGSTVDVAARTLAYILRLLSQDAVITGLYSLGNVLSTGSNAERQAGSAISRSSIIGPKGALKGYGQQASGSAISLDLNGTEETSLVYANVVRAVVGVAAACKDEKITALALSMLLQKLGRVDSGVDLYILKETAKLAITCGPADLKALLRLYSRFCHEGVHQENAALLEAVSAARIYLARNTHRDSPLFQVYRSHLLESIISKGDVHERENAPISEVDFGAQEIVQLIGPWAILTLNGKRNVSDEQDEDEAIESLQREAWFNLVVHGMTPGTKVYNEYKRELRTLAVYSNPLIPEDRVDQVENEIELNTVLRRGMNAEHTTEMKRRLGKLLSSQESNVKALTYPRVIFLCATYMVETLRAESGHCASILTYFVDPSVKHNGLAGCLNAIADHVLSTYLRKTLSGRHSDSSGPLVAKELALVLKCCCHRVSRVQHAAMSFADRLINQIPSSLCQKSSLFTLLELLTLLWSSCLEAEIDEYEWRSTHSSALGKVSLQLSDDYEFRRMTLEAFHKRAKIWMMMVINIAPLDVKGLLQTYLSEHDDDGAYGHIALGRSFALEMGSSIPTTDQRLGAIPRDGQSNINTGSDFIAQYTTRQEYRYADPLPDHDPEWMRMLQTNGFAGDSRSNFHRDVKEVQSVLAFLSSRVLEYKYIAIGELRDVLRRAAALLCRSKVDHSAIVHYLVEIPFALFTKQAIKLGISLWLGVINENPRMEPQLLTEIAAHWERSVQKKQGVFSPSLHHPDPFYVKEEFAPSNKASLSRRQQSVQNLITPHTRILQFISSHFNANRLGSPHLRRTLHRMMRRTLNGLKATQGHPLTREVHFQIILFALRLLRVSDDLGDSAKWRFKDRILSSALAWFSQPARWSFGGNRIQIKAEAHLMSDVLGALATMDLVGSNATKTLQSLRIKEEILILLLNDEQMRLRVWLTPLDHEVKRHFALGHSNNAVNEASALPMIRVSWAENPALAIQLAVRFQSPSSINEVRRLVLEYPHRAVSDPEAYHLILKDGVSNDVTDDQLKYLLYWAPVNPITAATCFLPAYKNNPFVIQFAMRALEFHSVDVTFFYVPQFVQILRYDNLRYMQQYIVETAKFSQLFAHQIIWNMKANAYKDEDSTIVRQHFAWLQALLRLLNSNVIPKEDPIKPALDEVLSNMLASFSDVDKDFYEREFAFFNEITDISGKLRPLVKEKRSKAEKKQKIEEELRKIKVDVGVYLPSNPDGVVVGIDRKSGKPLQSHAKAPYMATFKIKKTRSDDMEVTDSMLEQTDQNENDKRNGGSGGKPNIQEATYEVFQSAIFKVGDDCRQDILALQMIAAFRGIFNSVGLDVYVYPYRVTATAPGCGVIDVLPQSISRDMLGRETVNGLYDYFVSKYGGEESIRFQEARNNFVKSMAAYSIISYLLQFKDRHNGNIMVDDAGHILHIDFGFCFDIAPGGIRFERAPFKLTGEMVAVMGGSPQSQSYRWFEELCIKAFLAVRIYADKLCHMVQCMLDSGLPCFKPFTVKHFRERFVLERGEREAAAYVRGLVEKSRGSYSTGVYDGFQLLTNGIPY